MKYCVSDVHGESELILNKLREYFPSDGNLLDLDTVDRIETLPYYIEKEDFICAHAGVLGCFCIDILKAVYVKKRQVISSMTVE